MLKGRPIMDDLFKLTDTDINKSIFTGTSQLERIKENF